MSVCPHPERRSCIAWKNESYFKGTKIVKEIINEEEVNVIKKIGFEEKFTPEHCPLLESCPIKNGETRGLDYCLALSDAECVKMKQRYKKNGVGV